MGALELFPAVDVAGGRAVQLTQGAAGSERVFGDPLEAALRWQEAGARWVHLVDIDAAFGSGDNRDVLACVVDELDVDVQVSGGVCDESSLASALATGCRRVNVATTALADFAWCASAIERYGDRLAVGLDVRGTRLAPRGSNVVGGDLYDVLARLDAHGCARYVVTDVTSDGMLCGPNLALLRDVCARTDRPVVSSGGVATLDDVRALVELVDAGLEGAIIGTALHTGALSLREALSVADG